MSSAVRLAPHLQRLAAQRLSLVVLTLGMQFPGERTQGAGASEFAIRALGLEPGKPHPPLSACAAIARGSAYGSTGRSRGTHTAARAGRRLRPPSTAGTSSRPLPSSLRVKVRCERTARRALCRPCWGGTVSRPGGTRRGKRAYYGGGAITGDRTKSKPRYSSENVTFMRAR
eukprot:scaffold51150_cov82-Phaeocystis_antarctica.AAC.3